MLFFEISIKFFGLQRSFFAAFIIDFDQHFGRERSSKYLVGKQTPYSSFSIFDNKHIFVSIEFAANIV